MNLQQHACKSAINLISFTKMIFKNYLPSRFYILWSSNLKT